MRPELFTEVMLHAVGLPTVGRMKALIIEHRDLEKAILESGLQNLEWSLIAKREGVYKATETLDFTEVLRGLTRLNDNDFIYDGRRIL